MTIDNLTIFASETAKEAEGIAALGIDGKTFIVQLITWLIVFTVLVKFVFKPIVNVLQKATGRNRRGSSFDH
jgi:hypothetical protein